MGLHLIDQPAITFESEVEPGVEEVLVYGHICGPYIEAPTAYSVGRSSTVQGSAGLEHAQSNQRAIPWPRISAATCRDR